MKPVSGLYKKAENYLGERRKSNRNTGGTTSAKTMGRCGCAYRYLVTGYKYTFTFDGAEDVLVNKLAKQTDNGTWLHSKTLKSSRIARKCSVFPRGREYVSRVIDQKFVKLLDVQ